jgi:hypothetical protein
LTDAEPETVLAAAADYQAVRPKILATHYSDYRVLKGGQGAGTVATWKLQATKSRVATSRRTCAPRWPTRCAKALHRRRIWR